jgi:GNAT superfamily N-acetyltransferase
MNAIRSAQALFASGPFRAIELGVDDIPALQGFFDCNPEYFVTVTGLPPKPSEAQDEIHDTPPEGMSYTRVWVIGFVDGEGALVAMASVVSDLLAPAVWHIGLLIVASALHGSGVAPSLYGHLEGWIRDSGARWLRLGVVQGNARAERFWERSGFRETRKRGGVQMGARVNTIRVMVKPLAGGTLPEYLALVARDRPEP